MGLKGRDDPPARVCDARRGKRRRDLGGMMRVVVDDGHASRLTNALEAPLHAVKLSEPARQAIEWRTQGETRPNGREGIEHIVAAVDRQRDGTDWIVIIAHVEARSLR